MPSSYNGWIASRDPGAIGINTRWEPLPGIRFPGGTKSGDVQTIMTYLVRNLSARVERVQEYPAGDDWGYVYRANVNNPSTLSCHASGTAIDYNATQHPNQVDYTWTAAQSREIHHIIDEELDGIIKWLEGYDEMHFEIRGNQMAVARVALKIRNGTQPTPPSTPSPAPPIVLPAEDDDDMPWILQATGKPTRLMSPPVAIVADAKTIDSARYSGFKTIVATPTDYDEIISQITKALD